MSLVIKFQPLECPRQRGPPAHRDDSGGTTDIPGNFEETQEGFVSHGGTVVHDHHPFLDGIVHGHQTFLGTPILGNPHMGKWMDIDGL